MTNERAPSEETAAEAARATRSRAAELRMMQFLACGDSPDPAAWAVAQVALERERAENPTAAILDRAPHQNRSFANVVSLRRVARRWLADLKTRALEERTSGYEMKDGETAAALFEHFARREESET